jgi:hypothetical protein
MAKFEACSQSEVRQTLALFLAHMIAVRFVRFRDRSEPAVACNVVLRNFGHRVANLVVILDRILGLVRSVVLAARASADVQQFRIEELFFGECVNFEKGREARPQRPPSARPRTDLIRSVTG